MARQSYLMRREGRYYFNSRFAPFGNPNDPRNHIRFALRTASYKVAVRRIALVLPLVAQYRDVDDFRVAARNLLVDLDSALGVTKPLEDHLVLWSAIEKVTDRFITAARAVGYNVIEFEDFWPTWIAFSNRLQALEKRRGLNPSSGTSLEAESSGAAAEHTDSTNKSRPTAIAAFRRRPDLGPSVEVLPFEEVEGSARSGASVTEVLQIRTPPEDVHSRPAPTGAAPSPIRPDMLTIVPAPVGQELGLSLPHGQLQRLDAGPTFGEVASQYLAARATSSGDDREVESAGRVFRFALAFLGDKPLATYGRNEWFNLEQAIIRIPHRDGLPGSRSMSIYERFCRGRDRPGEVRKYLSETTIKGTYYASLHKLFSYAEKTGVWDKAPYKFDLVGIDNPEAVERDAFKPEEMRKLFSLPLFQGSRSDLHFWKPGRKLVQNEIYWALVLIVFTGLRHSEMGKLLIEDLVFEDGRWMIDLKELKKDNASAGDKNKKRKLKTKAAARKIPVPHFVIELGFLDRKRLLEERGEERLFPEWKNYTNKQSGRPMPGQHLSKTWQYLKKNFDFDRESLTLYSGRHTRAGWLDALDIPKRIRNRLLGHSPQNTSEGYGPIDLSDDELKLLEERQLPIEVELAELLMGAKMKADAGELERIILPSSRERRRVRIESLKKPAERRRAGRRPKEAGR